MKHKNKRLFVVNLTGGLGYIACLLQWFWLVIVYLPVIVDSPVFQSLVMPSGDSAGQQAIEPVIAQNNPAWLSFVALGVGLIFFAGLIFAVFQMSKSLVRAGKTVTHKPVDIIIPQLIKQHHIKPEERNRISRRMIFLLKLLLCVLPAVTVLFARNGPSGLDYGITLVINLFLFSWSFVLFCLQALLCKLLRVDYRSVN